MSEPRTPRTMSDTQMIEEIARTLNTMPLEADIATFIEAHNEKTYMMNFGFGLLGGTPTTFWSLVDHAIFKRTNHIGVLLVPSDAKPSHVDLGDCPDERPNSDGPIQPIRREGPPTPAG